MDEITSILYSIPINVYILIIIILIILITILFICSISFDEILLRRYNAQKVESGEFVYTVMSKLTEKAITKTPELYLFESPIANSFSITKKKRQAILLTTTAVNKLKPEELEAVIAHELGHIKHSNQPGSFTSVLSGLLFLPTTIALWAALLCGFGQEDDNAPQFVRSYVMALVGPLTAALIQLTTSGSREYIADEYSARLCGVNVLVNTLKYMDTGNRIWDVNPTHARLFFVNPLSDNILNSLFNTHPSIEKRIRRLEEIDK
ncbi:MAG: M48 family metalloprotease [Methanosarcinales archaeon]|nr:M48 family metalloprotease [Methanosarcinales archaeon]